MSGDDKRYAEHLCKIMDAISDPILEMSDEDLLAEVREDGEDPGQVAAEVKEVLLGAIKSYRQRNLIAAAREYERQTAHAEKRESKIPTSPVQRRKLLDLIFARQPELLTFQNREFRDFTDTDVEGLLTDLEDLGALEDLDVSVGE